MIFKRLQTCCAVLFLFATFTTIAEERKQSEVIKPVGVEEYDKLRTNANVVVLDVRTAAEFEKGHIPGATNIDINSVKFDEKIGALDKSKTYLVNCAVGMRSEKACNTMEKMGFKHLYNLESGFDGWKKARKPVEK